jgi:hypothetical protein
MVMQHSLVDLGLQLRFLVAEVTILAEDRGPRPKHTDVGFEQPKLPTVEHLAVNEDFALGDATLDEREIESRGLTKSLGCTIP